MNIKKHIPNSLTLGNLFCGCIGILYVLDGQPTYAFYLMLVAVFFDFLDGFVARLLKVSGELGAQLDSLADAVTFGVLPSMFMYKLIGDQTTNSYLPYVAFYIALMSVYRLAKFNIDTEQSFHFKGLPTPINAIFIGSIALMPIESFFYNLYFLLVVTVLTSVLLISKMPLLALKFKSAGWKENQAGYILIISSAILLGWLQMMAIPIILPLYLLVSFAHFKLKVI